MKRFSEKNNLTFGIILSYVALGVSIIGAFFVTPFLLEQIGDSNYGLLSFCTSITSWIGIITSALSGSFLFFCNKELKEKGTDNNTPSLMLKIYICISVIVFIILGIVVLLGLNGVVSLNNYSDFENKLISWLLFISGTQVCVTMLFNVFSQFIVYKKEFIFSKSLSIFIAILTYVLNVVLAYSTKSIIVVALATLMTTTLTGVCNLVFVIKAKKLKLKRVKFSDNSDLIKELLKYSSLILIGAIANNLHNNIDKTILGLMIDSDAVTLYQLSITFTQYLIVIAYSFTETLSPKFYEYYRNEDYKSIDTLYLNTTRTQSIILFFVVGGYISCGFNFIKLWIGEHRVSVYFYSIVLMISEILPLCNTVGGQCVMAQNKHKFTTYLNIFSAIFNVLLSILLLLVLPKEYGIWACVAGTVIVRIVDSYIIVPIYHKVKCNLPVGSYYLQILKNFVFLIVGVMSSYIILYEVNFCTNNIFLKTIISGISFVLVYFILEFIFERDFILKILRKMNQ